MRRLVLLGFLLVVAGCGGGSGATPTIEAGECFDDAEDEQIEDFDTVDCDDDHQNEVFFVYDTDDADDFPGTEVLHETGMERCTGEPFAEYVGETYEESRFEVFTVVPSEESWGNGDREVVCALYDPEDNTETGSANVDTA